MRYFLNIIIAMACLTLLCGSIAACGNPIEYGSKGNGVEIPCDTDTPTPTMRTAPLSSYTASSAPTTPTSQTTPSESTTSASETTETPIPPTTPRPNPKYVTLGERTSCAGQRIDRADTNGVRLFNTWVAFHLNAATGMTGFSFERTMDFPISAVIATSPGAETSYTGAIVLLNGAPLTGYDIGYRAGQSLSFFVNDSSAHIDGFVFCE